MTRPSGFEVRAFGLAHVARRRRLFDAGLEEDVDFGEVDGAASAGVVCGHAAVFNSLSVDLGGFVEKIASGAFASSLRSEDVRALAHHDQTLLLGRTGNGTLRLREDSRGLAFELSLPATAIGLDVLCLVGLGTLFNMSFGFVVPKDGDTWAPGGGGINGKLPVRTLHEVRLFEVSQVAWPAYLATSVVVGDWSSARRARLEMLERGARLRAREASIARGRKLRLLERGGRCA
jgi:uncharacterized protein